jgi:hypothetical protein
MPRIRKTVVDEKRVAKYNNTMSLEALLADCEAKRKEYVMYGHPQVEQIDIQIADLRQRIKNDIRN